MKKILANILLLLIVLLASCGGPSVPEAAKSSSAKPGIFPDYTDVTVPSNISPLNFMVKGCDAVVARFTCGAESYVCGEGDKVIIPSSEWERLRSAAKGKSMKVEVFTEKGGEWTAWKPFAISVAEEPIDRYVSYRLIQPSYVAYEDLAIVQRDLTTFDESDIYNNRLMQTEKDGQCINCHSYQNYRTSHMLFHARQAHGGTVVVNGGKLMKVDMKTDSTISSGVYPAWHPEANLVAFSTNTTRQMFLTKDKGKVEVVDFESDLILYDVDKNTVSNISNSPTQLEVFPAWSPDGRTLYYCVADFQLRSDSLSKEREMSQRYKEIRYSLFARSFDPQTRRFGAPRMMYDAAAEGRSVTLPRVSPDGRYVVFALGDYGCFHIWHSEADICMLDTQSGKVTPLKRLNSPQAESYPSFSSNGRWIMTESRRDDGSFTRPYIAYFDKQGRCHKAFEIPQEDPERYTMLYRSFNRPEFMVEPVSVKPREFATVLKGEAKKAKWK